MLLAVFRDARLNVFRAAVWLGALVAVELIAVAGVFPDYVLPRPSAVAERAFLLKDILFVDLSVTLTEIMLGLALAIAGSIVWATLFVLSRTLRNLLYPVFVAAQSAPKEALAPVFVIWFGFSYLPKILLAALIAFFPVLVATIVGLERFDPRLRMLAQSMGAGRIKTFLSFRLWDALPSFMNGVRVGLIFAAVGAVLAEFLGSDKGIGYRILQTARQLDGASLYASVMALVLVMVILTSLLDLLEKWMLRGAAIGRAANAWL